MDVVDHETLLGWLTRLQLTAIRDQLDSLLDEAADKQLTLREALAFLVEREVSRKDERRIEMAFKIAHFPAVRELADFDFKAQPSIDERQVRELATRRAGSRTATQLCFSVRLAWARRTWRSRSGVKRSGNATRSCSPRPRR
jgi:DNA replication protein DnaC